MRSKNLTATTRGSQQVNISYDLNGHLGPRGLGPLDAGEPGERPNSELRYAPSAVDTIYECREVSSVESSADGSPVTSPNFPADERGGPKLGQRPNRRKPGSIIERLLLDQLNRVGAREHENRRRSEEDRSLKENDASLGETLFSLEKRNIILEGKLSSLEKRLGSVEESVGQWLGVLDGRIESLTSPFNSQREQRMAAGARLDSLVSDVAQPHRRSDSLRVKLVESEDRCARARS